MAYFDDAFQTLGASEREVDHFVASFRELLGVEGGYVNDPRDSGGATRWGITEALARQHDYRGRMQDLDVTEAKRIYRVAFWDTMRLDEIAVISPPIANELFEAGVNMGTVRPSRWLQQCLNVLNDQGRLYPNIAEDGRIGPVTIRTLDTYLRQRRSQDGERVMLRALNSLQGAFYIDLATRRPKDQAFIFGWLRQRVVIK